MPHFGIMLARQFIGISILALGLTALAATAPEQTAYDAALRSFEDKFYQRANEAFTQFITKYPESDLVEAAEAFAMRSRAHIFAQQENHLEAATTFRNLRLEFPNSPDHLEFVVGEAWSEQHLGNFQKVIQLLDTVEGINGPFKLMASIRPNDPLTIPLVVSGQLLLAQAYLDLGDYEAANKALSYVTNWDLRTEFIWRRRMIMTRIQLAEGKLELALQNSGALLDIAIATEVREWIAESAAIRGQVLIANDRPEGALLAYKKNLEPSTPPNYRREAWFKTIELSLEQRDAKAVIELLNQLVQSLPEDDSLDVALLTLGELNLQRFYQENIAPETPAEGQTTAPVDHLNEARITLERLIKDFPNSTLVPEAQYHRGWCYWELGDSQASMTAFQDAAQKLPPSFEAAVARFKLADGFYVIGDQKQALANYQKLIESYENDAEIRDAFLDQVLYQIVRTSVAANDSEAARVAIDKLIGYYPDNLLANRSRLIHGEHLIHIDKVSEARGVFYEMIEHFTNFPLKPEVEFAIAYSWELEGQWKKAAALYQSWLQHFPNHAKRPNAAYALAWSTSQQGDQIEALARFREFIGAFPDHSLTNLAQLWIGNYYFNQGNFPAAVTQYGLILGATDVADTSLRYQAAIMMGRSYFRQNMIKEAYLSLKALSEEIQGKESVDLDFRAEVELNLGDVLFEMGKQAISGSDDPFSEARFHFSTVGAIHSNSRLAAIARARYGDASFFLKEYSEALSAYNDVIRSPEAEIGLRSQAEIGIGIILEQQAREQPNKSAELNTQALHRYLNVVHFGDLREGETPDTFWLEEAGLRAASLIEAQGDTAAGIELYRRLADILPVMRQDWDRIRKVTEAEALKQASVAQKVAEAASRFELE